MQGTCQNLNINLRPLQYQTKTIARFFKTIYFTCGYNEENVEADDYSKEECHVAEGSVVIEECMDEIIYALTSELWVMDIFPGLCTSRMKMLWYNNYPI